jgi:signal transduction histidine kinase
LGLVLLKATVKPVPTICTYTDSYQEKDIGYRLGLHLISEIIKLEGGQLRFISKEGKGSTFTYASVLQQFE